MLNIVIFGAPGSGKGTQSAYLREHFNLEHISTGDMLRSEIKKGSATGKLAHELISEGHLVPDDLIIRMLDERLDGIVGKEGVIFDGFPRTVVQARALEDMLARRGQSVTALVDLEVEEEELVQRIIERGKVSGRTDDNEQAVQERLKAYHTATEPVLDYFGRGGKVIRIEGTGAIEAIAKRIIEAIEAFVQK